MQCVFICNLVTVATYWNLLFINGIIYECLTSLPFLVGGMVCLVNSIMNHKCTCIYTYVHTYIHTYICTYRNKYFMSLIFIVCIRTYVCTYIHTYIHTYGTAQMQLHTRMRVLVCLHTRVNMLLVTCDGVLTSLTYCTCVLHEELHTCHQDYKRLLQYCIASYHI